VSLASLLNQGPSSTFAFEHAMSHRRLLGAMSPLDRFSIIPYQIEAAGRGMVGSGTVGNRPDHMLDHGVAHEDYQMNLPGWYGTGTFGIMNPAYNLVDNDLMHDGQRQWWTHQNFQEHLTAENVNTINQVFVYPFW
jgi:hypothetical protein